MNFKNPLVLVPTIVIGVGALAYGVILLFSGSSSNPTNNSSNYSPPPVNNQPPASYDSPVSDGANFINGSTTNSNELPYSSGGSRKKKKRRSKSRSKSKSRSRSKSR